MSRLKKRYLEEVKNELQKKFEFTNPMMIPVVKKIVINMGIAEASKDKNSIQDCISELSQLSGQKPIITKSRKAISNYKLREGQTIGLKDFTNKTQQYHKMQHHLCQTVRVCTK